MIGEGAPAGAPIPGRVHLVGIGGMHMSAIGRILMAWGHSVSGSDLRRSPLTDALAREGARVSIGHAPENVVGAELVVTTSAAPGSNPEVTEAGRRGIPVIKRADMVARIMRGKVGACIAGSHGKSTTSGLVAFVLRECGRQPTFLIGAEIAALGTNASAGAGPHVVVEADEYDRAFLSYEPRVALVLNVEPDHLDYYGSEGAMKEAFSSFVGKTMPGGTVVLCADSSGAMELRPSVPRAATVETYSLGHDLRVRSSPGAGWTARLLRVPTTGRGEPARGPDEQRFQVMRYGQLFGEFSTVLPGVHNVSNTLGAMVLLAALGLSADDMRGPLARYTGVRRRFDLVGEAGGVTVIDDYAHHPTEVEALAAAARARFPRRRIAALFQPHTYARTRYLLDGFKTCFRGFDALFLLETYAAREAIADGLTAEQLAEEVVEPRPVYCRDFEAAAEAVSAYLRSGDVFFTVGAGDVDAAGPLVLERLRRPGPGADAPNSAVGHGP